MIRYIDSRFAPQVVSLSKLSILRIVEPLSLSGHHVADLSANVLLSCSQEMPRRQIDLVWIFYRAQSKGQVACASENELYQSDCPSPSLAVCQLSGHQNRSVSDAELGL